MWRTGATGQVGKLANGMLKRHSKRTKKIPQDIKTPNRRNLPKSFQMEQEQSQRKSQHIAVGQAIEDEQMAKAQTQELTSLLEEQGPLFFMAWSIASKIYLRSYVMLYVSLHFTSTLPLIPNAFPKTEPGALILHIHFEGYS